MSKMQELPKLKVETRDLLLNAYGQEDAVEYLLEAIDVTCRGTRIEYDIYKYFVDNFGYIEE